MIYLQKHKVIVRDAEAGDIGSLALTMRRADREEIWAQSRSAPEESLKYAFEHSELALTVIHDGKIAAMFGIVPISLISNRAIIWLLSSEEVPKMGLTFAKYSRPFIKMFLNLYPVLENWVDARYTKALSWLKFCGFTVEAAEPIGIDRLPFNHVIIRRADNGPR
jgi:hypothetical protein